MTGKVPGMKLNPTRFREARGSRTQAAIAHQADIVEKTYRRLEAGVGTCNAETLARVANVLGVPMESLFDDAEVPVA